MRPNTIAYIIGQGFKGVFRNRVMTVASMLVLIACMILVGTFYLVIDTIDRNMNDIEDLRVIEIMVSKEYDGDDIIFIGNELKEICDQSPIVDWDMSMSGGENVLPEFYNFQYVSPDEHWEVFVERYPILGEMFHITGSESHDHGEHDGITATEIDNPLRASFKITFNSFSDVDEVRRLINKIDDISPDGDPNYIATEDIKNNVELHGNVMDIKNVLYVVGIWLMAIFLVISLFVIMNTIKLGVHARENEIKFMRLCGATKWFIRMPFIIEGMIIGLLSAAAAFGVQFYIYEFLLKGVVQSTAGTGATADEIIVGTGSTLDQLAAAAGGSGGGTVGAFGIVFSDFSEYAPILAIGFVAIGMFAGVVASSISMKKFLKA